jgi:peptidoglycan hydrolase-like protein with peptidoglycan-binding domain
MNKTYSTVLSSLVLSGAVFVMAPQAWSQAGGSSGTTKSPAGSQKSDPSASGSQRGTTGSSGEMQSQREQAGGAQAGAARMSKEDVKQVQAALKNKGMDPGPEDGVLGPKTQQALREFQKSNNMPATGRIDEKTASALGVDVGSGTGRSSSGMGSSSSSTPSGAGAGSKSGAGQSSSGSPSSSGSKGGTTR